MAEPAFEPKTTCSTQNLEPHYFGKNNFITVKFKTFDGKVFTQSYSDKVSIFEIKSILIDVFGVARDNIIITKNNKEIPDGKILRDFPLSEYESLALDLHCTRLGFCISAADAYKEFAIPDVITVRIDDYNEEEGFRDVVVEILDHTIVKPFLGGYVDRESGVEYHHGYTQTGPAIPKVPPQHKTHRDTQTYFWRNRLLETKYARATQMTNEETWIPTVTDKILTPGPYETSEEWEKRLAVEDKVRTIQRYYWAWKMRKALKVLSAEYKKRIALEQELEQFYIKDNDARKKRELIGKVFPRTKDDFCMLYAMVDRWKKAEIKRICNSLSGAAKITSFYMLLDKEIKMLRAIECHRTQIRKEMKDKKIQNFFNSISTPLAWNNHFKTWINTYKDFYIEMDTLETQKGAEYYKMFSSIYDKNITTEERLQGLLNIKLTLLDHNCQISTELISLINRACELIVRRISSQHLDMLMKRIEGLFIRHIKEPECSFGVTNRIFRVKEKLMHNNLYFCSQCQKLKPSSEFEIHPDIENFKICLECNWDDRTIMPWIDFAPYRYILRLVRREERMKQSISSIAFILQDVDIYYLITKIWHSHSAVSEVNDIYRLRLIRWFKDVDWSPWNCILLTEEEIKVHLQIKKLDDIYDLNFLSRIYNKHQLAKSHFKKVFKLEDHFHEFGESDIKWNEIKEFKNFVAVNSKTKIFLSCH